MHLIGAGVLLILFGGAAALLLRQHPRLGDGTFRALVLAGCLLTAVPAVEVLLGATVEPRSFVPRLPGGLWVVGLDELSAWFVLLLSIVAGAATAYGVTYLANERAHRSVGAAHAVFSLLVAAMVAVLTARAAVLFLMAWEVMALSAYLLIVFEHELAEVRRAGLLYLILTHVGAAALLVMFLAWGHASPDLTFSSLALASPGLPWGGAGVLLLALFGFGAKAGVFPFHFWLPGAHAAAPSHVSALLSGVMLKTGIYGLLRVLTLFGSPPAWWGWTVLFLGLASAVLGVLWALAQHDLKRLLAYSSVENIGIILLGLGLGALGQAYHQPALALLGFTGALLHSLNHALFKSLLFLGAGALVRATGTREIDRLGGLARTMPRTAGAFLIGSLAIVGLPPLNGFLGEWITVQGALTAMRAAGPVRFAGLVAAAIGLVGALALACFLRLGAAIFLGRSRFSDGLAPEDAPQGMSVGLGALATGCLIIGLAPAIALSPGLRVAEAVSSLSIGEAHLPVDDRAATTVGVLALLILLFCLAIWLLRAAAQRRTPCGTGETWGCAYPLPTARMQYTASSFSAPLLSTFPAMTAPETVRHEREFRTIPEDRVLRGLAVPVWARVRSLALSLRPLQQGRVTTYLQYIIWTVLLLLGYLSFASLGGSR